MDANLEKPAGNTNLRGLAGSENRMPTGFPKGASGLFENLCLMGSQSRLPGSQSAPKKTASTAKPINVPPGADKRIPKWVYAACEVYTEEKWYGQVLEWPGVKGPVKLGVPVVTRQYCGGNDVGKQEIIVIHRVNGALKSRHIGWLTS